MGRFHEYKTADGRRVPSVTTVLKSLGGNTEGLIRWAHKLGIEGKDLDDARQRPMDVGTTAHAMIEAHLGGRELQLQMLPADILEKARTAFEAWKEWAELTSYTVVAKETPLVSEEHRFGGTFDAVLIKKKRIIVDWKTSAGIYPEHLVQVAAYGALWNETHPTEPIEGFALLRLGRDEGLFDYHLRPPGGVMVKAWEAFLHARSIHDLMYEVKKAS
jgi:hypothetical protein